VAFDPLTDFHRFDHTFLGQSHVVYRSGEGPPVLVLSEMPGITPSVADFARVVRDAGMTVFMPHIFGQDGRERSPLYLGSTLARACVSREFAALRTGVTAPATLWLRDLMRRACGWTGYEGAGVVGMCFTGGFALAMLMEPELLAPVLSQPSLPIGPSPKAQRDLHMDPGDLKDAKLRVERDDIDILGLRFTDDRLCPQVRFDAISEQFGERFIRVEIDSSPGNAAGIPRLAHSVLTEDLRHDAGHPTQAALHQVIEFLADRLLTLEHQPGARSDG
jgi:dienelactone hydrolase